MKIRNSTRLMLGGALLVIGAAVTWRKSKWYDEFVNVTARKPSGWLGKRMYKDPKGHYKSFELTLEKLQLISFLNIPPRFCAKYIACCSRAGEW